MKKISNERIKKELNNQISEVGFIAESYSTSWNSFLRSLAETLLIEIQYDKDFEDKYPVENDFIKKNLQELIDRIEYICRDNFEYIDSKEGIIFYEDYSKIDEETLKDFNLLEDKQLLLEQIEQIKEGRGKKHELIDED